MYRIFLSSTFEDLRDERRAVERQITDLKQTFIGMEHFFATDVTALDVALDSLKKAQFTIFVIGQRYGSVDPSTGLSMVELEYQEALRQGKTILVYFKDDDVPILRRHLDRDAKSQVRLKKFKKRLDIHHRRTFTTPDDLAARVSTDLSSHLFSVANWGQEVSPRAIAKYRAFWQPLTDAKLSLVIEAGQRHAHQGELEYAKNVAGVLGLSEIIPALVKLGMAFNIENALDPYLSRDVHMLLDGSHTGNALTKQVLEHRDVRDALPFRNSNTEDRSRRWLERSKQDRSEEGRFDTRYEISSEMYPGGPRQCIRYDYGFLAKIRNPFSPDKVCLIASGNHGAGTYACMKVLATPDLLNRIINVVGASDFQAVVGISMLDRFHFGAPKIHKIVEVVT